MKKTHIHYDSIIPTKKMEVSITKHRFKQMNLTEKSIIIWIVGGSHVTRQRCVCLKDGYLLKLSKYEINERILNWNSIKRM